MRLIDLAGKRFDRWSVLSRAGTIGRNPAWLCRCDCGVERLVSGCDLREGKSRSCGCLQRDTVSTLHLIDMVGQKHGRLTVLERFGSDSRVSWLCRCDCGNEHVARAENLRNGRTSSCGCWNVEQISGRHKEPEFRERRLGAIQDHWEYTAFMRRMEEDFEMQEREHRE